MIELPDLPYRSVVGIEHRGEAMALEWPSGRGVACRVGNTLTLIVLAPFALAALAGLLWSAFLSMPHVAFRLAPETVIGRSFVLVASAAFLWMYYRAFVQSRRYRGSELLVIDRNAIVHSPSRRVPRFPYAEARAFVEELKRLSDGAQELVRLGACVFVDKPDVKGSALEGKGSFGIVSVKCDGYDIDMGRRLGHADRAWLAEVLRRWRNAKEGRPA
ncbi:MAG: hypothetical protein ACYSU0_02745 [Planctomycetota bacterium]|jgi:hypothetical protein